MRFTHVPRKQSFLAQSHLLPWVTCFHFFKKNSKTKPLSTNYKREWVHIRIICGTFQKYSGPKPHSSINELESQERLHKAKRDCVSSDFTPQASLEASPSLSCNHWYHSGVCQRNGTMLRTKQMVKNARRCSVWRTFKGNPKLVSHPFGHCEGSKQFPEKDLRSFSNVRKQSLSQGAVVQANCWSKFPLRTPEPETDGEGRRKLREGRGLGT